jgi:hypothetical protein
MREKELSEKENEFKLKVLEFEKKISEKENELEIKVKEFEK